MRFRVNEIRWKDAERDCTSAITLPEGGRNVKALYRRALARKALMDVAGALEGKLPWILV